MGLQGDVLNLLSEQLGVNLEKITLDSHIQDDLGADSLDANEMVMDIEEKYKIEIPDEEAQKFERVKNIIHYLDGHIDDKYK